MKRPFTDRSEAGLILAEKLREYVGRKDVIVLGLPRGGVPVAYEVARVLKAPLDILLVRKLGVPGQEELAMGAIASSGVVVINTELVEALGIPIEVVEHEIARERTELSRREMLYRGDRRPPEVAGRQVILVDDGLATGSTMRAAVAALRHDHPKRIVVAVPTASPDTCHEFCSLADDCICVITPEPFRAVGLWYENFDQVGDEEVCELLSRAAFERGESPSPPAEMLPQLEPDRLPLP